jgi:predicted ferric reductase
MILHPLFLIINTVPNWSIITTYVVPTGPIEVSLGVIAIYLFVLLIALTVALIIPYHWWKKSHQFLGITLLLAGLHAVLAGSDINSYYYLKVWIVFISIIGIISWLYMLLFYKRVGPRYQVTITSVKKIGDITEITLQKPTTFSSQPGQFIFIQFPQLKGHKELFPFSISNDPSQNKIRLSIKQSGDYTSEQIPRLKPGEKAIIMGPYGRFGERYLKHDKDMIWIAGGIGITPFLSLAKHESIHPTGRNIDLIWVIRNRSEAFHDHEIINETKRNPNFSYVHWFSDEKGRITAEDIIIHIRSIREVKKRLVFLCGPPGLMYALSKGLHEYGIPYHHIIFEDFNMLD